MMYRQWNWSRHHRDGSSDGDRSTRLNRPPFGMKIFESASEKHLNFGKQLNESYTGKLDRFLHTQERFDQTQDQILKQRKFEH